jgi:hypothetical protein
MQEGTELLVFLVQAAAKTMCTLLLQGVRFSVSSLSSLLQALPQAQALRSLYLDDLGTVPPASIAALQRIPGLFKLQLRSAATTHDSHLSELSHMPHLADLEIAEADNLTDEGLASLLQNEVAG